MSPIETSVATGSPAFAGDDNKACSSLPAGVIRRMLSERTRSYSVSKVGSGRRSGKRRLSCHVVTIAGAGQSLILRIAPISQVLRIAGVEARRQPLDLRYGKAAGQEQDCCRGV
jgi:hypothetical protein